MQNRIQPPVWSHNPYTGQVLTRMPFDLGSAIGNAQARALPIMAMNASSVPARAAANAQMYTADAQARIAQIQAQAALEQQRMRNQTLAALLNLFSGRMGGGGYGGYGGITTNYGAGVSPTPVTNYRGGK